MNETEKELLVRSMLAGLKSAHLAADKLCREDPMWATLEEELRAARAGVDRHVSMNYSP